MFVKVIYPDGQDVLHECKRRRIRRLRGNEHLFMLLDGHIELEICDGTEAFVMNDQGETIEAHRTKLSGPKMEATDSDIAAAQAAAASN